MRRHRPNATRACRPGLEPLEPRRVPAQFGVPWHASDHLTISFVPDGTPIAGHRSDLFGTLDAVLPTADWQRMILRAFQTWAVRAHLNFAVTADDGEPFGVPGPDQGDPRFGDIRIGAQAMSPEVLSISVPHDPFLSGTWSGDVLLNSALAADGRAGDLFPILLHEVGHVLGLDHSDDPSSVMFAHLDNRRDALAPGDIAAVQGLYDPRPEDPFEGPRWNDTTATATPFPEPSGFDGTTPLFLYADISSNHDVDVFSLRPPAGVDGPLTVRLQTAGVSLLAPRLVVTDAAGHVLADLASGRLGGDTLQATLPRLDPGATYYLAVRGATGDVFGIGEYVLAATFDARSTVGPDAIDRLARQSYSYLSPDDLNAILRDPAGALFHDDRHTNDTFTTAEALHSVDGYGASGPVRITASLGDPADVDVYHFETPYAADDRPVVMTVTGRATQVNGLMPRVEVFDERRDPVPALVLAHGDGTYTVQVANALPGHDYDVRVAADPTSGKAVGNYDLDVEFGHVAARPTTFASATLDGANPTRAYALTVNQTQLFDFLLAAMANPGVQVRMTVTDAEGRVLNTRVAVAGATTGGDPVLLSPGVYRVAFEAREAGGSPAPVRVTLYGASLSDPIGPALDDPTLRPMDGPPIGVPPGVASAGGDARAVAYTWLALNLGDPDAGPTGPVPAAGPAGGGLVIFRAPDGIRSPAPGAVLTSGEAGQVAPEPVGAPGLGVPNSRPRIAVGTPAALDPNRFAQVDRRGGYRRVPGWGPSRPRPGPVPGPSGDSGTLLVDRARSPDRASRPAVDDEATGEAPPEPAEVQAAAAPGRLKLAPGLDGLAVIIMLAIQWFIGDDRRRRWDEVGPGPAPSAWRVLVASARRSRAVPDPFPLDRFEPVQR